MTQADKVAITTYPVTGCAFLVWLGESALRNVSGRCSVCLRWSLFRLRQTAPELWQSLVGDIRQTVSVMPLWKLQIVGNERLEFLYENVGRGQSITLKPGVAFCFRAFYGLLHDLIQAAWIRFVQRLNTKELGSLTDLGSFLFGREREALEAP
jgi:hypothetical protein